MTDRQTDTETLKLKVISHGNETEARSGAVTPYTEPQRHPSVRDGHTSARSLTGLKISIHLFNISSIIYLSVRLSIYQSIHMFVCLSISPSICLSVYLSVHPSVCLSIYPVVCLYLFIHSSDCLSVYLSIHLVVYLSSRPSIYLFIISLVIYLSSCLSTWIENHANDKSIPLSIHVSVSVCLYNRKRSFLSPNINIMQWGFEIHSKMY